MGVSTVAIDVKILRKLLPAFHMFGVYVTGSRQNEDPNTVLLVITGDCVPDCPQVVGTVYNTTLTVENAKVIELKFEEFVPPAKPDEPLKF